MNLKDRIKALVELSKVLNKDNEELAAKVFQSKLYNQWFTEENSWKSIEAIKTQFLDESILNDWTSKYQIKDRSDIKKVGLVLAGNIPLVGWHDIMCCFVVGHKALIKLSDKDKFLTPFFIKQLEAIDSRTSQYFEIIERLKDFDAVIATGSNNTSKYFENYFGKYPHIIRANRNAVAVLTGKETDEEIKNLGADIFEYFGLGCRNVSMCLVPQDLNWERYLSIWHEGYKQYSQHNKYKNNFDHNVSLFILNKTKYMISGSLIVKEDPSIASRISSMHYQCYNTQEGLTVYLTDNRDLIQCVVSSNEIEGIDTFRFGHAQHPKINDYADGVDTMNFLTTI
tara:strand:+ start:2748 stop:3767 length:1020 start_codon:yes stop_codon:yes gene_type:complete